MDAKEKAKLFEKTSTMPDSTLGYKGYDAAVDKAKEQAKRTPPKEGDKEMTAPDLNYSRIVRLRQPFFITSAIET